MPPREGNGWEEHKKMVLHELERHDDALKDVHEELRAFRNEQADAISDLKVEVGKLSVKASVWGGLAGVITAIAIIMIRMAGV